MASNPPDQVRKLQQAARIASIGNTYAQPPGLSPEKPRNPTGGRAYTELQKKEAVDLAAKVGVTEAERITGISRWTIYKAARDPYLGKESPSKKLENNLHTTGSIHPHMLTLIKAARSALYWYNNIQGITRGEQVKKDCFRRAAKKFDLNFDSLWTAYTHNKIDGVPYP
jgi:hypothetical protein